MFAKIGWAYDLKQPSAELVRKTIEKHGNYNSSPMTDTPYLHFASRSSGDGTHPVHGHGHGGSEHGHMESVAAPGEPNLGY